MIFRPEMRLRVDWDGDGYLNGDVPEGTPPNLINNPIYVAPLLLQYVDNGSFFDVEVIKETTPYGFEVGRVEGTNVTKVFLGLSNTLQKPDDAPENIFDYASARPPEGWNKVYDTGASQYGGIVHEATITDTGFSPPAYEHVENTVMSKGLSLLVYWFRAKKTTDTVTTGELVYANVLFASGSFYNDISVEAPTPEYAELPADYNDWSDWVQVRKFVEASYHTPLEYIESISASGVTSGAKVQIAGVMLLEASFGDTLFPEITNDATQVDLSSYYIIYDGNSDPTAVEYNSGTGEFVAYGEVQSGYNLDNETGIRISTADGTYSFNDTDGYKALRVRIRERDQTGTDQPYVDITGGYDGIFNDPELNNLIPEYTDDYLERTYYISGNTTSYITINDATGSGDMPNNDISFYIEIYDLEAYEVTGYWKPTGRIDSRDGLVSVDPTNNYMVTVHFRAEVAGTIDIQPKWVNIVDGSVTLDTAVNSVNIGTDWTRVDIPMTAIGGTDIHVITLEIDYTDSTYLDITGLQLVEGTTKYPYHVGSLADRDVIQNELISVQWQSGRNEFDEPMAFEGTLEATLNNDSLKFVPNGDGSIFKQNLKVVLEVYYNFEWVTLWTGWTESMGLTAGRTSSRDASFSCVQGVTLLREAEFSYEPVEDVTMDETVKDLIGIAGWKSAYDNFTWQLAFNAYLGENTYLQDTEAIFSRIDTGVLDYELIGMDWSRRTELSDALTELLNAENAKMWVDREGGLVLVNRYHEINQDSDVTIYLDTDVQEANYRYGQDIVNQVEIVYSKKEELEKQPVWSGVIGIPRRNSRNPAYRSTIIVPLEFNFTEGRPITITKLYTAISDMDFTVYRTSRLGKEELGFSTWDYQVHCAVNQNGEGKFFLQLRNNLDYPVEVDITLYADYIEGADAQPLVVADLDAQQAINAVHRQVVENKQLSNPEHSNSLGLWILNRKALPKGEFIDFTKVVADDADLGFINTVQVGTVVSMNETTMNEVDRQHIVIAEEGTYQAGDSLRMVYTTAFMDKLGYAQLGDEMEYDTLSAIPTRPAEEPMLGVDGDNTYVSREDGVNVRVLESSQFWSSFWYTEEDPRYPIRKGLQSNTLQETWWLDEAGDVFNGLEWDNTSLWYFFGGENVGSVDRALSLGHYRYTVGFYQQARSNEETLVDNTKVVLQAPTFAVSNITGLDVLSLPTPAGSDRLYTKTDTNFLAPVELPIIFDCFGKSLGEGEIANAGFYAGGIDGTTTDYLNIGTGNQIGSVHLMRLDRMTRFQLEPSTTYYGKIEAKTDGSVELEVTIVELTDDMTEHISTIDLTTEYAENGFNFTTSADCELVVIGYRVKGANTVKIKAMGISDTDLTLDEMEVQNKKAFRVYV